jgi:hypothetical protein
LSYDTFLCSHKFHKIESYFIFEMLKKKLCASFQRIIELFTQKFVTKLSKIWVWGTGPGVKKAPDPGSGSATMQNYEAIWAYLACGSSWRDDFSYDAVGRSAADSQRRRTA